MDSLIYEVCTDYFYRDMWAMKGEFDLASYAKSSPFYDPTNNKVVGSSMMRRVDNASPSLLG